MQNISERIKTLRQQKNMTQKELAEKLHVSNNVVSKWELGQSEPDINSLYKLSSTFNMSIGELLGETQETTNSKENLNLNQKCFNFFKNYYMLIIQIALTVCAIICACAGFGWLIDNDINIWELGESLGEIFDILPNYAHWVLLVFSLSIGILQIIVSLAERGNKFVSILKYILLFLCFGLMVTSFVYLGLVKDKYFKKYYIVCGVTFALFTFSILLNCLVEMKLLKTKAPFKIGKILTILMLIFVGFQIALTTSNIITTSIAFGREYYEQRTPDNIAFERDSYTLYNIDDQLQAKINHASGTLIREPIYTSLDPSIATVDQNGIITAISCGKCTIEVRTKDNQYASCDVYVVYPYLISADSNYDIHKKNQPFTLMYEISDFENYNETTEATFYNDFTYELFQTADYGDDYEILEQKYENGKITVKLVFHSIRDSINCRLIIYYKGILIQSTMISVHY